MNEGTRTEHKRKRALHVEENFFSRAAEVLDMDKSTAELALENFLSNVVQRVSFREADHLLSQLPVRLRDKLEDLPAGPNREITASRFLSDIESITAQEGKSGKETMRNCWLFLEEYFNEDLSTNKGELSDIRDQLPQSIIETACVF